jgi:hypothetical protein
MLSLSHKYALMMFELELSGHDMRKNAHSTFTRVIIDTP